MTQEITSKLPVKFSEFFKIDPKILEGLKSGDGI